jgi:quercetin dioxygenase-like cupin family protein
MRSGSRPSSEGLPGLFTGKVRIEILFTGTPPGHAIGQSVTFEPGARNAWHSHPAGQALIVTAGEGVVQSWGGPIERIHAGDVVYCPPGEKHWHGAAPDNRMTHIAIQEEVGGRVYNWMEKGSEGQPRSEA